MMKNQVKFQLGQKNSPVKELRESHPDIVAKITAAGKKDDKATIIEELAEAHVKATGRFDLISPVPIQPTADQISHKPRI